MLRNRRVRRSESRLRLKWPSMAEIDNLLREDRSFPPSNEWKSGAIVSDPSVYERAAADPEAFWAAFARELDWIRTVDRSGALEIAERAVVRRRQAERQRQLRRSPRAQRAAQSRRHHLGRRAGRPAHADLLGSVPPGERVRQRPQIARREEGRSRRPLPAAHSRAGHRHARLRAHRRRAQRRLRRLQRRVAARSHQRRTGGAARHRRRRLPPRPDRAAQTDGRRGAQGHPVNQERRRRPAAGRLADSRRHPGRPRSLVSPADAACRRRTASPRRWTPRTCSTSSTPRARRESPRASCTRPADIWSARMRRRSGCSISRTTTSTGARPTSDG